ncbi:PQQ-dependent sugar dehydrogenase [Natrialba taiwanensis]|uniref:Blue (Type 1) copper domain-containing protein n=1 Tax=Natrialba taiwanensis DSM 12281 TaxID=1230458 RepID=M0ABX1_9EURY|nr:PQQ-dependent sugar dehydrogenase [Natrialba taiwanensis]ELY96004.1 blue (type 1) copper domain-containing protein [Natrialba taiwanensis DSM 12281]
MSKHEHERDSEPTGEDIDEYEYDSDYHRSDGTAWLPTRRRMLQATAAAGGLTAVSSLGLAQDGETIELGGETSGWQGVAPSDIEGETNPTLELEAGTTYELTWENLDGLAHNVVIVDGDGGELERTELMSEEGETQTLEFEATSEMAEYYCEPHAATMRGEISVGEDGGADDGTEEETDAEPFFQPGAEIGLQTIGEGMTAPTDFAAVEGEDRYFVADQTGELWVIDGEGVQDEPFIDVSDRLVELGTFEGSYADPDQDYDERGLLGVELHPEFTDNGRFFLHYSAPPNDETPEGWSHVEVVAEFQANDDLTQGEPDSERVLMEFQKPQYNHDAGPMAFGPDGCLYVPMGDGGGANDDMEGHVEDWYDENAGGNGQDVSENLLGGIHRIDVNSGAMETGDTGADTDSEEGVGTDDEMAADTESDSEVGNETDTETSNAEAENETEAKTETDTDTDAGTETEETETETETDTDTDTDPGTGDKPYGIPEDNPLVDEEEGLDEYYAWGFRNPFGISFDSEGRLFASDAGQDLYEEANIVESGGNYGWNVKEGTHCFSTDTPSDPPEDCPDTATDEAPYNGQELQDPIVEYPHVYDGEMVGITIIGGHVYESSQIEDLQGKYIFGDWTADPSRQEPAGRLLAATDPDGTTGGDDETGDETTDDDTTDTGTESADDTTDTTDTADNTTESADTTGNETADNTTAENGTDEMADSNETATDDTENGTTDDTADNGAADDGTTDNGTTDDQAVPRDELWEMEELQVSGTDDGSFPYFVRQFGQDSDGNVYVLANREGVPEGDTGVVMEFVAPDEGEELSMPDTEDAEEQETDEEATEDTQDEPVEEGENGNETTENESTETDGNETIEE